MLVHLTDVQGELDIRGGLALDTEAAGYDALWLTEVKHDPFLTAVTAAAATSTLTFGTGIAVAFARNPMTLAVAANDLHLLSAGRFILGLGSQIKPHITRRFSMPWSAPAARMRECVLAIRAIWRAWETGEPLRFQGEFFTHTLMTPRFDPGPNRYGNPPIFVAAVGDRMTEVAGEVADGLSLHSFTTPRYLREATLPALARGRAQSSREHFQLSGSVNVATGRTAEQMTTAIAAVKERIAFYGSTPAYRPVLDLHGWGELQPRLRSMSKRGLWAEMGDLVDDDLLTAMSVVGEPEQVADQIIERFGALLDRITLSTPYDADPDDLRAIRERLQAHRRESSS